LRLFAPHMARQPAGFATMGMALNEALRPTRTLILRGAADHLDRWRCELSDSIDDNTVLLVLDEQLQGLPPVLDKRGVGGTVNAYLCEGVICHNAVQNIAELRALMGEADMPTGQGR